MKCPICGSELKRLQYTSMRCCDTCELILPIEHWQDKKIVDNYKKGK